MSRRLYCYLSTPTYLLDYLLSSALDSLSRRRETLPIRGFSCSLPAFRPAAVVVTFVVTPSLAPLVSPAYSPTFLFSNHFIFAKLCRFHPPTTLSSFHATGPTSTDPPSRFGSPAISKKGETPARKKAMSSRHLQRLAVTPPSEDSDNVHSGSRYTGRLSSSSNHQSPSDAPLRAHRACEKCTRTKKKCDKGLPACSRCTR